MDIDPLVVTITKINGALYAPWLAFPLPAHLFGQDPVPPPPTVLRAVPAGTPHPLRVDDPTITTGTQLTFDWEAA
ncbi:MAG: hypothetical protein KC643_13345 [Nitrospira sp.]|nr:hypothetical protein [Nitrospira sp.]MCA9499903.1 hypothetical protein [Nitrospira sp.]